MSKWKRIKEEIKTIYKIIKGSTVMELIGDMNVDNLGYIACLLRDWLNSQVRKDQLLGEFYYLGDQEILKKERKGLDEYGHEIIIHNVPNYKIINNLYSKMVKQKANYVVSNPITFQTDNKEYLDLLREYFSEDWDSLIIELATDVLNGGIAFLHPYYDQEGDLKFKNFPGYEIMPAWHDKRHTSLDFAVRLYTTYIFNGSDLEPHNKVEIYTKDNVREYTYSNDKTLLDQVMKPYIVVQTGELPEQPMSWGKIPIIPFKRDPKEIPLIKNCKSLQDSINRIMSIFCDSMEQDNNNSVLVVTNYDGENVNTLRSKVNTTRVIPVRSFDGIPGDVKTLQMEVNADNYNSVLHNLEKAFIKNCQGYDIEADILSGGDINQMKIKTAFSEIDLDARAMVKEFKKSIRNVIWFINRDIERKVGINYDDEELDIIFNLDMIVNETEQLNNCNTMGIKLSQETLRRNCPWVLDVEEEEKQYNKEQEENQKRGENQQYNTIHNNSSNPNNNIIYDKDNEANTVKSEEE